MSFATKSADKFATVFDKSNYYALDPIVKIQYVQRGNNVAFGRELVEKNYAELIYIGKIVEQSQGRNFLSADAWLDTTFPHVIYISGTRGSGKSFDLGVLLEGISRLQEESPIQNYVEPACSVLIDTQSQFWTLRYRPTENVPENQEQLKELSRWKIGANALQGCRLFMPEGSEAITGDEEIFHITTRDVRHEEWCDLIGEDEYSPQGHVLGETLRALGNTTYSIADMVAYINTAANWSNVADSSRNAVIYKLRAYERSGLFAEQGITIEDILQPGQCSVLLLRDLRNVDKSLVTSVIARQMFTVMGRHHKNLKVSQFFDDDRYHSMLPRKAWLFIDEAHVVAPKEEESPARGALIEYVKRGRDAGLSLVLATQQPSAVDDRILSQVNVTLTHRLAFQSDINAACNRIPTRLLGKMKVSGVEISDFGDMLRFLEPGQCFLGDNGTSRTVMLKIRPRVTSHGGYSPT